MKALVKTKRGPGLDRRGADPRIGRDDVLIRILKTAICGTDVHIYAWDAWASRPSRAARRRARVRRRDRRGGRRRATASRPATASPVRATSSAATAATAAPAAATSASTRSAWANRHGAFAEYLRCRRPTSRRPPDIPTTSLSIFDPLGNAPTRPCRSTWSARTCSSPGPVPSASWRSRSPPRGARHVVITDVNASGSSSPGKMGATRAVERAAELADVMQRTRA